MALQCSPVYIQPKCQFFFVPNPDAMLPFQRLTAASTGVPSSCYYRSNPSIPETYSCEYGSPKFFAYCAFGGLLSCGLTHTAVVPLDLVKCRMQVDPAKYGNIINGFRVTVREGGMRELGKGWAPTFFGYSMQGVGKFGFYEVFKMMYGNMLGEVGEVAF